MSMFPITFYGKQSVSRQTSRLPVFSEIRQDGSITIPHSFVVANFVCTRQIFVTVLIRISHIENVR